jgi:hypothetical protein
MLVAVAVGLSGCDVLSEFTRPAGLAGGAGASAPERVSHPDVVSILLAFAGIESRQSGTNTPTGPGTTTVSDKVVTGPFKSTLPVNIKVPSQRIDGRVVTNKVKGNFAAQFDGSTDANTATGTITGIGVLSFKLKALGTTCFQMTAHFTQRGAKGTGTFRSTGGTGGAAKMRATGTFTDTISPIDSATSKDSGKIHLHARLHKPAKAAPADCKALVAKLPG